MPQRPKFPDNVLTRLRKALSSDHHKITRQELSRRTAVSWASIRDIERGAFRVTPRLAAQISLGVPVQAKSLLAGDDPLLGWDGLPLGPKSPNLWELTPGPGVATIEALFKSLCGAVLQKQKGMLFTWLFIQWAAETAKLLDVSEVVSEKLINVNLGSFDDKDIPEQFHPRQGGNAQRWRSFFEAVNKEELRILKQKEDQNPIAGEKFAKLPFNSAERRKRQWESTRFYEEIRREAIERVGKLWKAKDEEFMRSSQKSRSLKRSVRRRRAE